MCKALLALQGEELAGLGTAPPAFVKAAEESGARSPPGMAARGALEVMGLWGVRLEFSPPGTEAQH